MSESRRHVHGRLRAGFGIALLLASIALSVPTAAVAAGGFVQQVSARHTSASGSSIKVVPPSNVTAGNRLIVLVGVWNDGATARSVSDSAGNTYTEVLSEQANDATELSVWTAPIAKGGGTRPTVTATASGSADIGVAVLEYSGLSSAGDASAVDQKAADDGFTSTAGTVSSGPTPATTAAGEQALGFYVDSGFGDTVKTGSGWTSRVNSGPQSDMEFLVEDQTAAQGSTPSASASTGANTTWLMATVVFKLASSSLPGAPTGVTATAGNAQATVSWTAAAPNGSAITGYTVTSSPGGLTASVDGSTTTATVTGLTNGTAYTFTVTAANALGTGPPSAPSNAVTPATVPDPPTGATAAAGNAQATVSWVPPASSGGSAITQYTVTSSPGGLTASVDGSTTTATVTGLTNGTAYTFTVTATNAVGTSAASTASGSVTPMTVPGAPTAVAAAPGDGQAIVSWTAPASNGGASITRYTVTASPGGQTATTAGATSATVTGLSDGTSYTFTVTATNAAGTGAASAPSNAIVPAGPPGAPTGVAAVAGNAQATVSWTAPTSNGGVAITGYTVVASPGGQTASVDGGTTTATVTGLTNGTSYTFTVTATTSAGTGPQSGPSNPITPSDVPGAPTGVTATGGNAQAVVTWTAPASNGGTAISSYSVTATPGGLTATVDGSTTTATITGLTNGTSYTFTVTATNAAGTGAASAPSGSVTPVTTPGAPTSVTATAGSGRATVSWSAPTTNGGTPVTLYTVTSNPDGRTVVVNSGATSAVVTGLSIAAAYTFTVTATNAAGTGPASAASNPVSPVLSTRFAAGAQFTLAVNADGTVWAWGRNQSGQLGPAGGRPNLTPVQVPALTSVTSVAAGDGFGLALESDGTVWAWGDNSSGQLGNGTTTSSASPVQVSGLGSIAQIAAGGSTALALRSDGTIWEWGHDPTSGNTVQSPLQVQSGVSGVVEIATSGFHSLALRNDGTIWAWGNALLGTASGGAGQVTGLTSTVHVAAGSAGGAGADSLAVEADGTVWAWGRNRNGQLGNGTTTDSSTPVQVSGLSGITQIAASRFTADSSSTQGGTSLALASDGGVWAWGSNWWGQLGSSASGNSSVPVRVSGLGGASAVALGRSHALAGTSSGGILAWGDNQFYELGDGTSVTRSTPVQADPLVAHVTTCAVPSINTVVTGGHDWSLAVKPDGSVWTWGSSPGGPPLQPNLVPVQVPGLSGITSVAAGDFHALALKSDGTVWAWGTNAWGQLGSGTTTTSPTPVQVPGLSGVVQIAAAGSESLALRSDGTMWQWGESQPDQGSPGSQTTPRQVEASLGGVRAIAQGQLQTVAVRCDGTVWSSEVFDNVDGELGNNSQSSPFMVVPGDSPQRALGLANVTEVAAGTDAISTTSVTDYHAFTLALEADGTVWAWGANSYGQLGIGTTTSSAVPIQLASLSGITAVAAHGSSTPFGPVCFAGCPDENAFAMALGSDGTAWSWGDNSHGQLGTGTTSASSVPVRAAGLSGVTAIGMGNTHALAREVDGSNWAWGDNTYHELADGTSVGRATPTRSDPMTPPAATCPAPASSSVVAAGNGFSLAIEPDGTVVTWGAAIPGSGVDPQPVPVAGIGGAISVAAGSQHALALASDGTVWAWGANGHSQLGNGTTAASATPIQVPGLTGVVQIAAAGDVSLALRSDGTVWQWGEFRPDQINPGTYSAPTQVMPSLMGVKAIAQGQGHTVAVRCDGTVWSWGVDFYGQMGNGTSLAGGPSLTPFILSPGDTPQRAVGLTGVTQVAVGQSGHAQCTADKDCDYAAHTLALRSDGTVWSWGYNGSGELGNGTTTSSSVPVQVSGVSGATAVAAHGDVSASTGFGSISMALGSDGTVWTWGRNASGQLGNGTLADSAVPVAAIGLSSVTGIAAGTQHVLVRRSDGTNWNWGDNSQSELADGTNQRSLVPEQAGT